MAKPSFFERLTGATHLDDEYEEEGVPEGSPTRHLAVKDRGGNKEPNTWLEEDSNEGQLGVDVYQTANDIVIKTMVAGVKPEDLDISITRDMVTIKGKREGERSVGDEDFFHRELYWGSFSRTVMLPQEVDIEESEAVEKHGLLIIKLPKLDKNKEARLRVKAN